MRLSKAASQKCVREGSGRTHAAGTFYNMAKRLSLWHKNANYQIMELTDKDESQSSDSSLHGNISAQLENKVRSTVNLQDQIWSKLIIKGQVPNKPKPELPNSFLHNRMSTYQSFEGPSLTPGMIDLIRTNKLNKVEIELNTNANKRKRNALYIQSSKSPGSLIFRSGGNGRINFSV